MNSFKTVLIAALGLTAAAVLALFTASLVVAFAGIATVLLVARAIAFRLQPQPRRAHVHAQARRHAGREPGRIWNDGKGTIIDM